ncbi:MAG: DUF488 family protein [Zavarzinia sp.]|nr:DUF488 family protein [Zavarzinia sp.]
MSGKPTSGAKGFVLKRVQDPVEATDGFRVLVDRLWPRGISKAAAALDLWAKDIAPSTDLRQRTHAGEFSYEEFATAYALELALPGARDRLDELRALAAAGPVTLLFAARERSRNNATALLAVLVAP